MAHRSETMLYLERASNALQQAEDNLNLDHYDVVTSRAYYAIHKHRVHPHVRAALPVCPQ